jgi:hypothetical protein
LLGEGQSLLRAHFPKAQESGRRHPRDGRAQTVAAARELAERAEDETHDGVCVRSVKNAVLQELGPQSAPPFPAASRGAVSPESVFFLAGFLLRRVNSIYSGRQGGEANRLTSRLASTRADYVPRQPPGSEPHSKVPTAPGSGGHSEVPTAPGCGGLLEFPTSPGSGGHLKVVQAFLLKILPRISVTGISMSVRPSSFVV